MPRTRQIWSMVGARCGSQPGAATVLLDFDFAQVGEIIDDVLPLQILVIAGREALEQFRP
jgi:hypothetical protein